MNPTPELVALHLDDIHVAVVSMENAREDRDEAIRQAYRDNVPVTTIAAKAGLSRQRVYQIAQGG